MSNPYLSIIIPVKDGQRFLPPLLKSIYSSSFTDFEVIIVDDVSRVRMDKFLTGYPKVIYIRNKVWKFARSRDVGAKASRGKILVFIDMDVVLYKNTLKELAKSFKDPKVNAIFGSYDYIPANKPASSFHHFKALRDYAYLNIDRDESHPLGGFGGSISAIRRETYKKTGGFRNYLTFRGRKLLDEMGDMEMGARINKITPIVFNPKVKIRHNFHSLTVTFRNFVVRTASWMQVYQKYKLFVGPAMNPREALIAGLANISTLLLVLSLFLTALWIPFLVIFGLRLFLGRKFLLFAIKKMGIGFLPYALFYSHTLYLAVYLGVLKYAWALLKS